MPMSDEPAPTLIETEQGMMPFQNWFVEAEWQPVVTKVHLPDDVRATPSVLRALEKADIVVLAPSNPFVSIDPILNVYPIRAMISDLPQAVVLVSPLIGGKAVKGPTAKLMVEMGLEVAPRAVANYYDDLIDIFVYDKVDAGAVPAKEYELLCTNTLMKERADRIALATDIVTYTMELINE